MDKIKIRAFIIPTEFCGDQLIAEIMYKTKDGDFGRCSFSLYSRRVKSFTRKEIKSHLIKLKNMLPEGAEVTYQKSELEKYEKVFEV